MIAVYLTSPGKAVELQNRMICELQPRDNLLVCAPEDEGDPF